MFIEEPIPSPTEDNNYDNDNDKNKDKDKDKDNGLCNNNNNTGENEDEEEQFTLSRPASHLTNEGLYVRKMASAHTSSSTFATMPFISDELPLPPPPESVDNNHLIVTWPSALRHSDYLPLHMNRVDSPTIEQEEAWTSSGEGIYRLLPKSDSVTSAYTLNRGGGGGRRELLEKCLPLMRDHYCMDEICYKLSISHDVFWKMVQEFSSQLFMYYIIPNL